MVFQNLNRLLKWQAYAPKLVVANIRDISSDALRSRGITAIITDLDNTLVPWRRYNIGEGVTDWLAELEGHGIKIVIASNTLHTGRLKQLADTMQIPFVESVRKPFTGGFVRAMKLMDSSTEQTAVIGDQIFTDVLCGNLLGLTTILLRPPLAKEEFVWTRMLRNVEGWLIARLQRRGVWPGYLKSTTPAADSDCDAPANSG